MKCLCPAKLSVMRWVPHEYQWVAKTEASLQFLLAEDLQSVPSKDSQQVRGRGCHPKKGQKLFLCSIFTQVSCRLVWLARIQESIYLLVAWILLECQYLVTTLNFSRESLPCLLNLLWQNSVVQKPAYFPVTYGQRNFTAYPLLLHIKHDQGI